jgi:uncharacterized membrane protein
MLWLILGLVLFLGTHAFTMQPAARTALVARLGERGYKGFYTLISLIGLVLIIWGFGTYRAGGYIPVWMPPVWLSHLALLLNLPVFILLAASAPAGRSTGKIQAVVKHPMLLAVKIWAAAHLLANGDLGSILLFGGFLVWAVLARISMKRRPEANPPAAGAVPFGTRDRIAIGAGLVLYVAFIFWLHPLLIGVPVLP